MNEIELGAEAFWVLTGVGFFAGVVSVYVFRRWSDWQRLRTSFNRVVAHLFELRLFADEPALVLRAQRDLIQANARLLRDMAGPSLLLVLPFGLLLVGLDAMFARAPLQPGRAAVVTLQYEGSHKRAALEAQLVAPDGVQVETPPVHVPADSQISWRVRPIRAAQGQLKVHCNDRVITKSISSVPGIQWLSDSRPGSVVDFLRHPLEFPFSGTSARYISVEYPRATVFDVSWIVWFSLALAAGGFAALVARRLGLARER